MISIIVLTYNGLEQFTKPCINSILKNMDDNYEIIVVDNASGDGTGEYIRSLAKINNRIKLIENRKNYGYAGGNNIGIRSSNGDTIILLNNDTIVTPSWAKNLESCLRKNRNIGLLGCFANETGTEQTVRFKGLNGDNVGQLIAEKQYLKRDGFYVTRRLTFFCVAFRRDFLDRVGLLDESFGIGMFEDDEYCIRSIRAGFINAIARNVFIYHSGSASFNELKRASYHVIFQKNRELLLRKTNIPWTFSSVAKAKFDMIFDDIRNIQALSSEDMEVLEARYFDLSELFDVIIRMESNEYLRRVRRLKDLNIIKFIKARMKGIGRWRV